MNANGGVHRPSPRVLHLPTPSAAVADSGLSARLPPLPASPLLRGSWPVHPGTHSSADRSHRSVEVSLAVARPKQAISPRSPEAAIQASRDCAGDEGCTRSRLEQRPRMLRQRLRHRCRLLRLLRGRRKVEWWVSGSRCELSGRDLLLGWMWKWLTMRHHSRRHLVLVLWSRCRTRRRGWWRAQDAGWGIVRLLRLALGWRRWLEDR